MQCGLMKKGNRAEEMEPRSAAAPARDGSQQTIPPICLPLIKTKAICISATALSRPNGSSIHFTDECTVKWREQRYYEARSVAGMTAVFTANRRW